MTSCGDNLALFSPCMFGKGSRPIDISHISKVPASFSWSYDNSDKCYSKTKNVMPWSPTLTITNESSLHSSTAQPCAWKSSNVHERASESDDMNTDCCCEGIPKGSEDISVACWNSGLLLDDEKAKGQIVEGSSPWSEGLLATGSAFVESSKNRGGPRSRESTRVKKTTSRVSAGAYRHIPHRNKPPQLVARRNARERRRVQAVNSAFSRLRKVVPMDGNRGKRVSKVKTLHKAIEYISQLQDLLIHSDPTRALDFRTGGNQDNTLEDLLEDFEDDF